MAPSHLIALTSPEFLSQIAKDDTNVNARNSQGNTPLHLAVEADNLDLVSFLLDNNADTEIKNCQGQTAFMTSLIGRRNLTIQEKLLEHVKDFHLKCNAGTTALTYALKGKNAISGRIIQKACNVYYSKVDQEERTEPSSHPGLSLTDRALYDLLLLPGFSPAVFWSLGPVLLSFVCENNFETPEWLLCLCTLLDLDFGEKLVNDVKTRNLFIYLTDALLKRSVQKEGRLVLFKAFLKLNYKLSVGEAGYVHEIYGFEEELELFINYPIYFKEFQFNDPLNVISRFVFDFSLFATNSVARIFEKYWWQLVRTVWPLRFILVAASFFAFRPQFKDICLSDLYHRNLYDDIKGLIDKMPTVPSLMELSRNKTLAAVVLKFPGEDPTFYHNYLKRLPVPNRITDVLRLKAPVYHDFELPSVPFNPFTYKESEED